MDAKGYEKLAECMPRVKRVGHAFPKGVDGVSSIERNGKDGVYLVMGTSGRPVFKVTYTEDGRYKFVDNTTGAEYIHPPGQPAGLPQTQPARTSDLPRLTCELDGLGLRFNPAG